MLRGCWIQSEEQSHVGVAPCRVRESYIKHLASLALTTEGVSLAEWEQPHCRVAACGLRGNHIENVLPAE